MATSTQAKFSNPDSAVPDFITDPSALPEIYAMICAGDCMSPEIKDGEAVGFLRDAPIERGDLAAFFFKPELVPPGQLQVAIKRVLIAPPPWVEFPYREHPDSEVRAVVIAEQINPYKQYSIPCTHLLGIHKCLGVMPEERLNRTDLPSEALANGGAAS